MIESSELKILHKPLEEEAIKALLKNKKTSTEEAELSSDIDEYISSITKSSPESLDTALTPGQSNIDDKGQPTSQLGDEDDSVESMTIDVEAEVDANNIRTNPKLLSNFIVEALVKALAEEEQALIARKASGLYFSFNKFCHLSTVIVVA